MTLWHGAIVSLAAALTTAIFLSLRTPYRPVAAVLAWGLAVDLVVGDRDAGWGLAAFLTHRPWSGADVALWRASNALVTSWPVAVAVLAWWAFQGPQKTNGPDRSEPLVPAVPQHLGTRTRRGAVHHAAALLAVKALAACWFAANMALVLRGVADVQRALTAIEVGAILAGSVAVYRGRLRRGPMPVAAAWLLALEVLVVAIGPFRRSVYHDWDLARLIYTLGFAVLAIGQIVHRLRPPKAGSTDGS